MKSTKLSRRHLLSMGMMSATGVLLAACQPKAEPTAAPAAPAAPKPAEPTAAPTAASESQQTVECWGASGGAFAEDLLKKLEEANAKNKVAVDYVVVAGGWSGMTQKLNASVAAKSVPDLAAIKDFMAWDYAWRGAVQPLDDYFADGHYNPSEFRKSMWDSAHYQGNVISAPWPGSFVHILGINDELFEKAGLDPATDAPTTWDELVEVAGKMTDLSANPQQFGHMFYELSTREYMLMLLSVYAGQLGGTIFSEDKTKVTVDTPECQEAMQWMHDMLWKHKYALPVELMDSRWDMVYSGVVGTMMMGPWQIWSVRKNAPQLRLSVAKIPCNVTCDNVDACECLAIMKDAEDPDLSWEGIKVLLNKEWDSELALPRGAMGVFAETLTKGAWVEDETFSAIAKVGTDPELRPRSWVEGYEEIASVITPELQAIWFDKKDVKEALADADKAGNEVMQRIAAQK